MANDQVASGSSEVEHTLLDNYMDQDGLERFQSISKIGKCIRTSWNGCDLFSHPSL